MAALSQLAFWQQYSLRRARSGADRTIRYHDDTSYRPDPEEFVVTTKKVARSLYRRSRLEEPEKHFDDNPFYAQVKNAMQRLRNGRYDALLVRRLGYVSPEKTRTRGTRWTMVDTPLERHLMALEELSAPRALLKPAWKPSRPVSRLSQALAKRPSTAWQSGGLPRTTS